MKPLYVRLPIEVADKLDRAALECRTSKQDLVAELIRRCTIETHDDCGDVGCAACRPCPPPEPSCSTSEVLNPAQAARYLQTDEASVIKLAEDGDLPGRKLPGEWRFARQAVLDWLANQ